MGSVFGTLFRVSTWGESHGVSVGVVVDGCPPRLPLSAEDIQHELDTYNALLGSEGDLLRTTPEALLKWLQDPAQGELLYRCRRLLLGFLTETYQENAWWMKVGTAPVPGEPGAAAGWVVGSNGYYTVVLHLPKGAGKAECRERFQKLMGIPVKKK